VGWQFDPLRDVHDSMPVLSELREKSLGVSQEMSSVILNARFLFRRGGYSGKLFGINGLMKYRLCFA
jgi:hypothetical protein